MADLDDDNDTTEPTPLDLDGYPRFVDNPNTPDIGNGTPPLVDMGPYEYPVDCNCNGIPDEYDIADCAGSPDCGDCSNNGVPDSCDIDSGTLTDANGDGFPDECEAQAPTAAASPYHDARKNRYVSISPNNIGTVGFRIELTSMKRCSGDLERACRVDDDCEEAVPGSGTCIQHSDIGTAGPWWVQAPQQAPLGCIPGPCGDEDWFARVDSVPYFDTWVLATLHIGDCEVIPVATYELRACLPPDGVVCSDPLTIGTIEQPFVSPDFRGNYGDAVGPVDATTEEFTPPDGFANVVDVSAYILTKQNYGTPNKPQTHPTWIDLHGLGDGNPPQYILNVSDLSQILKALAGDAWTDDPGNMNPGECP